MTREEAISKVQLACIQGEARGLIKSLENLGLLKLDEPKSEESRNVEVSWTLSKAFRDWEKDNTGKSLIYFVEAAGLRIVEK